VTVDLPGEVLLQHMAILGKTGAGKTTTAKGIVEHLLDRRERVCIVDPTGVWWGLRLQRDGKTPAYPVVIFGGRHGDMPIAADYGAGLGEVIAGGAGASIIDTKQLTVADRTRFFTGLAEALLVHNRAPLHLVIDEAHLFAPQGRVPDPASGRMVHAANNLVSLGRGGKLAIILISQRPAKLHKDSLSQVETLVAHKLVAPQDRAAIMDWIHDQADPKQGRDLIASLPSLKKGDAWVWWPEGELLERRHFPPCGTFDSSRGLESEEQAGDLPPIDVSRIKSRLEATAREAIENDPGRLREQLRKAQGEITRLREMAPVALPEPDSGAIDAAYQTGRDEGASDTRRELAESLLGSVDHALTALRSLRLSLAQLGKGEPIADLPVRNERPALPAPAVEELDGRSPAPAVERGRESDLGPPRQRGAELRILKVLAHAHPRRHTRSEWATLAGMKKTGGTWGTYVSRLRTAGLIEEFPDGIGVTKKGLAAVASLPPAPSGLEERLAMWRRSIGSGPGRMLDILVKVHPQTMRRAVLAAHVRMAETGGTFGTYLSRLRSNGLIEVKAGQLKAADILWA
jgi:hypothetical protein